MMCFSISSIATGDLLMPSTHADSHGAGQILPVNSGKLLVLSKMVVASCQSPLYTASLNSGITLPSGQPDWQNGTPQSIHLAACLFICSASNASTNSL